MNERAIKSHKEWRGKIEINSRAPITNKEELAVAYTPGVASPCIAIKDNPALSYELTRRGNLVAVITDGTAVLGLGDIGPLAAMPVMEGKCSLFKEFADVDAFPICLNTKDVDEIVRTIELLSPSFGGINLEDIAAPRCFEIERRLKESLDIPIFHDDQHGTAIVTCAALINAARASGKALSDMKVVINGAGAAGIAIANLLLKLELDDIIMVDIDGILSRDGDMELNTAQTNIAEVTNKYGKKGALADALAGADAFIGVSRPNLVTADMVRSMGDCPVIFAMANPTPEIMPDVANEAGAFIVGTGRSDFPNQINNVLAFPGIFKGALSVRTKEINDDMNLAAAHAIAGIVTDNELSPEYILPDAFDKRVVDMVSKAVADIAIRDGLSRI